MKVKSKVWIEEDGKPVFGEGREDLLELIDAHGSINKAASSLGISYRKACSYIKTMEETLKIPLVERSK
ncbi:MAG TPA: LysR family transcriptional regulator, partial [Nitrospiria bacterium]|nr:LysR family transcriptional regulator [Nitrospiria bacterium]